MEIIEHGKTYKRMPCTNCRCVFATCKGECKMHDLSGKPLAQCPECGRSIDFEYEEDWIYD